MNTPNEISPAFNLTASGLTISGVKLEDIVKATGTPVFIYDADTIQAKFDYLRSSLPDNVEIFYSCKANPSLAVIKHLTNLGAGLEIASGGELMRSSLAGVPAKNVVFAGPSKKRRALKDAIQKGIYSINAESEGEIRRISEIATSLGTVANVSLRINPEFSIEGATLNMCGKSKQFGIDEKKIEYHARLLTSLPGIRPSGIHVFSASNVFSTNGLTTNLEQGLLLAEKINEIYPVKSVDVGAGIGIPYDPSQPNVSFEGLREQVVDILAQKKFLGKNGTRIIVELGRYLVGQSGVYVTSVVDIKESGGQDYILTDGGVHHMTRIPLLRSSNGDPVDYPVFNLSSIGGVEGTYHINGCLCTPLDFLAKSKNMSLRTGEDDLIGIFCAGAYGFTEGMTKFLSHDEPAEVLVHNGRFHVVNPPYTVGESVARERIPLELMGPSR